MEIINSSFFTSSNLILKKTFSKTVEVIKSLAAPVFLILGSLYLTLHYTVPLSNLAASKVAPFNVIGCGFLAIGILLYCKGLWDQSKREASLHEANKNLKEEIEGFDLADVGNRLNVKEYKELEKKCKELEEAKLHSITHKKLIQSLKNFTEEQIVAGEIYWVNQAARVQEGSVKEVYQGYSAKHGIVAISYNSTPFRLTQELAIAWNKNQVNSPILSFEDHDEYQIVVEKWYSEGNLNELDLDAAISQDVIGQVLIAYRRLHQDALIHGDPKPANIMFDEDETVHLVDREFFQRSKEDRGMGAHTYRSPELVWLESESELDTADRVKAEVWGVGLILAQLMSKEAVFPEEFTRLVDEFRKECKENEDLLFFSYLRKKIKDAQGVEEVGFKELCDQYERWNTVIQLKPEFWHYQPLIDAMLKTDPKDRCTMTQAYELFSRLSKRR